MKIQLCSLCVFIAMSAHALELKAVGDSDLDQIEAQELQKIDGTAPPLRARPQAPQYQAPNTNGQYPPNSQYQGQQPYPPKAQPQGITPPAAQPPPQPILNPTYQPRPQPSGQRRESYQQEDDYLTPPWKKPVRKVRFGLDLGTDFPVFVGGGGHILLYDRFQIGFGIGLIPQPYASALGSMIAAFANNGSYQQMTEDMFTTRSLALRTNGEYKFTGREGFSLGGSFIYSNSSGDGNITDIAEAPTGENYQVLKTYLANSNYQPTLHADLELYLLQVYGAYTFALTDHLALKGGVGFSKIIGANVTLGSSYSNFDNSYAGRTQLNRTQGAMKNALTSNGYTPSGFVELHADF